MSAQAYEPDRSPYGKLRRQFARLRHRRPLQHAPGRGMVSFTFDDIPESAATTGAALLERRGIHGTFYVSAGLAGRPGGMGPHADAGQVQALAERGHEIGCHTYSHLDCGRADSVSILADVDRNAEAIKCPPLVSFAYPYGDVSVAAKRVLGPRFAVLRGVKAGLVREGSDLNQAPAVAVEGSEGLARARPWIAAATRENAWLILFTHDVRENPSPWGTTPEVLTQLIDLSLAAGLEPVTVAAGARSLGIGRSPDR